VAKHSPESWGNTFLVTLIDQGIPDALEVLSDQGKVFQRSLPFHILELLMDSIWLIPEMLSWHLSYCPNAW
jgi:hypothetical protein